jgi:hypothetical protein
MPPGRVRHDRPCLDEEDAQVRCLVGSDPRDGGSDRPTSHDDDVETLFAHDLMPPAKPWMNRRCANK